MSFGYALPFFKYSFTAWIICSCFSSWLHFNNQIEQDTGAISPTYMVICEDCKDEPFFAVLTCFVLWHATRIVCVHRSPSTHYNMRVCLLLIVWQTSSSNVWGQIDTRLKRAVSKRARGNVSASVIFSLGQHICHNMLTECWIQDVALFSYVMSGCRAIWSQWNDSCWPVNATIKIQELHKIRWLDSISTVFTVRHAVFIIANLRGSQQYAATTFHLVSFCLTFVWISVLTDTTASGPSASAHGGGEPAKQRQRNLPKRHRAVNLPPVLPTVEPPLLEHAVVENLNIFETDSVFESNTAVEL